MDTFNNVYYIRKDNLHDGSLKHLYEGIFALGNFDGVHKGHLEVLNTACEQANKLGLGSNWGVIIFNPHPKEFLNKTQKFLITDIEVKISKLKQVGVPKILILDFPDFYQLKAEEFLTEVLFNAIKIKGIVVGDDFKFGVNRQGTIVLLEKFAKDNNIVLTVLPKIKVNNIICSSSNIREFISIGKIEEANTLLGHRFEVQGTVIRGNSLARSLGYATANILLNNAIVEPKYGVYLVKATVNDEILEYMPAIANFGLRPTFNHENDKKPILEVHILNLNVNLYNKNMIIKFTKFIRPEQKFSSVEDLKNQLINDVQYAKNYFRNQ